MGYMLNVVSYDKQTEENILLTQIVLGLWKLLNLNGPPFVTLEWIPHGIIVKELDMPLDYLST